MNAVLDGVLADLAAESDQIEAWVTPVDAVDWTTVTTPEGWTVTHQIAHLAWTDQASLTAIGGGEPFDALMSLAMNDPVGFVDAETERWAAELPPAEQPGHTSEAALVAGPGKALAEEVRRHGVNGAWPDELGRRVEQHALRTLYEREAPRLPAGFAAAVRKALTA